MTTPDTETVELKKLAMQAVDALNKALAALDDSAPVADNGPQLRHKCLRELKSGIMARGKRGHERMVAEILDVIERHQP